MVKISRNKKIKRLKRTYKTKSAQYGFELFYLLCGE